MSNAMQAAALEVPAAGESDASVPCCGMMVLARQKTARPGGEARVALHGHVPEAPLLQGSWPPCLGEPRGPQDQDQLRTMEQAAAYAPVVQILDIPVPQMVVQLADVMRFVDSHLPVPEQAIEVPKILLDDVPMRTALRDTQLAEQLVEVPTDRILFFPATDYGAARRHFSSWSWRAKRWSSRFSPRTEFNSDAFQETHF